MNSDIELSKENASRRVCNYVETLQDIGIIGLGTGSTIKKFIDTCIHVLNRYSIAVSSPDTLFYLKSRGLKAVDLLSIDTIDAYIDSADEVSSKLDLVKGRGAALFREKTLAYLSKKKIYLVDYTKYTGLDYLYSKPIPIEVVSSALNYVSRRIREIGLFELNVRIGSGKDGPVVSDNGNYIVDLKPLSPIKNPAQVHQLLKSIHGVVETGIFPASELVDVVVVGYPEGTQVRFKYDVKT